MQNSHIESSLLRRSSELARAPQSVALIFYRADGIWPRIWLIDAPGRASTASKIHTPCFECKKIPLVIFGFSYPEKIEPTFWRCTLLWMRCATATQYGSRGRKTNFIRYRNLTLKNAEGACRRNPPYKQHFMKTFQWEMHTTASAGISSHLVKLSRKSHTFSAEGGCTCTHDVWP